MAQRPPPLVMNGRLDGLVTLDDGELLSVLFYGAPGVGKTVLAATAQDAERTRPVLFCSSEGGHKSIMHRLALPESDPRHGTLDILHVQDFTEDMNRVFLFIKRNPGVYKTLVIDSLTDMAWRIQQAMLRKPNTQRDTEGALAWSEWDPFNTNVRNLIMQFRDLGVNLIATALETERKNDVGPLVGGKKTSELLPGFFNTVGRLATVGQLASDGKTVVQKRVLTLASNSKFVAKDRSDPTGKLPSTMDDPTIPKLLARAEQGVALAAKALSE